MRVGDDYILVICSVCNGQFHRKDTVFVRDKYNYQNGRVVCKWDLDEVNPLSYPYKIVEHPPSDPQSLTPDINIQGTVPEIDNRLPGAPTQGYGQASATGIGIDLYWIPPFDQGTSAIQGYRIERADPQLSTYEVIKAQTDSGVPYLNDTTVVDGEYYSYRIAGINTFGMGPYSQEFFFPTQNVNWSDLNYLVTSQDGNVITTGSGLGIRLNHVESGVI